MSSLPLRALLFVLALGAPFAARSAAGDDLGKLQQEAEAAVARRNADRTKLDRLESELGELQKAHATEAAAVKAAPAGLQKAADDLAKQRPALVKARAEQQQADAQVVTLAKAAAEAKGTDAEATATAALTEATNAAKQAADQTAAATKTVADLEARVRKFESTSHDGPARVAKLEMEIAALENDVTVKRTAFEQVAATALAAEVAHERALIAAGRRVSFAESIAPIFNERCVACHNARSAKGRFNMESYAAIMKGGESGPAVDTEDADLSNLYLQIADGEMPKDADPLSKEQIEIVRKWIATGATLDAGLDPDASLLKVMPKPEHPAPPQKYRVAIPVTALAFSPDGTLLASSGYHEVLLWNAETGDLVRRIQNVAERVYDIAFTADGRRVVVAAGTPAKIGEVRMFEAESGELVRDYTTTTDSVFAIALSPDGRRLATAGADRAIRVFDVETGERQLLVEDHADWVMDIAWSPDGKSLVSASRDKTAKLYDATTGEPKVTFSGHGQPVYAVGFTPDGQQVVSCGADKLVRVWKPGDAKEVRKIGGFGGEVFDLAIGPEGHLFTSSADRTIRQHELGGKAVRTFAGHADWVYSVALDPTHQRLATAGYDGEVRLWNAADGKQRIVFLAAPGVEMTKPVGN